MTLVNILLFALVLHAVGSVVHAWLTSCQGRTLRGMAGQCERFERRFVNVGIKLGELTKASPTNLAAEVAALSDAVSRLRQTQMRFQGRFDQYVGQERKGAVDDEPDDEFTAMLKLQANRRAEG